MESYGGILCAVEINSSTLSTDTDTVQFGTGDGITKEFEFNLTDADVSDKSKITITFEYEGVRRDIDLTGVTLSEDTPNTVKVEFNGNAGTPAKYTSVNDLTTSGTLTGSETLSITIDGVTVDVVVASTVTASTELVTLINTAFKASSLDHEPATTDSNKIVLTGKYGDSTVGGISIGTTSASEVRTVFFDSTKSTSVITETTVATDPTLNVPRRGEILFFTGSLETSEIRIPVEEDARFIVQYHAATNGVIGIANFKAEIIGTNLTIGGKLKEGDRIVALIV